MTYKTEDMRELLLEVQKPARYVGGEMGQTVKDLREVDIRFGFCFPDIYDIGMSHLGLRILYGSLNEQKGTWCERFFQPWPDMEERMRAEGIRLYSMESHTSLDEYDLIGFTLQYEMCYPTVLNMLELGGVPIYAKDRKGLKHIVVGGGPCAYNPEPLADFFDVFSIGEGEEALPELADKLREAKAKGWSREKFLYEVSKMESFYVPSLYEAAYKEDGTLAAFTPLKEGVPAVVHKRIIKELDKVYYPKTQIIPFTEAVHDRVTIELFRGCIRGCRFCQAGMLFRPIRCKSADTLIHDACTLLENTGYEQLSLCSLSSSDYPEIEPLVDGLINYTEPRGINLSLPSLRADNFSKELAAKITGVKKSTFTFAAEAGSQRLRDVINKNVTETDIEKSCRIAFENGNSSVKLYFMMGLPTETEEDLAAIRSMADKIIGYFYDTDKSKRNRFIKIAMSVATFIPKPFTAFQWEAQNTESEIRQKQEYLKKTVGSKQVTLSCHDCRTSLIEAVLARGDRRLAPAIAYVAQNGGRLDAWTEYFSYERWQEAFRAAGIDPDFYSARKRDFEELLPWDFIDIGVTKAYLKKEAERSYRAETTPNCKEQCTGCGANQMMGRKCDV
ncbi:MAG: TIGR03960 family B12-binding radical SAM protein [Clostridia bacterium]|nr:TIGR03960 family B12-binding radical SAM protein [Clostridia bacterium]